MVNLRWEVKDPSPRKQFRKITLTRKLQPIFIFVGDLLSDPSNFTSAMKKKNSYFPLVVS